jgi:hypothetical protein
MISILQVLVKMSSVNFWPRKPLILLWIIVDRMDGVLGFYEVLAVWRAVWPVIGKGASDGVWRCKALIGKGYSVSSVYALRAVIVKGWGVV